LASNLVLLLYAMLLILLVILVIFAMNALTFLAIGWTQKRLERKKRPIPESELFFMTGLSGWVGAWLGVGYFGYESPKPWFRWKLRIASVVGLLATIGALRVAILFAFR
jgi:uncharacterized membrane protein YsdA (DUF1294 family)